MKFIEILEQVKREKENKNKIVIAKCGAFFVAIGRDALIIRQNTGVNVRCAKPGVNGIILCRKMTKKNVVFPTYFLCLKSVL